MIFETGLPLRYIYRVKLIYMMGEMKRQACLLTTTGTRLCPSKGIVRLGCVCGTYIGGNTHIYDGGKWCSEPYAFHALWVWLQDRGYKTMPFKRSILESKCTL